MLTRLIILIVVFVLQVGLAFLGKIPYFRETLPSDPVQRQAVEATMTVVGLSLAAIGVANNLNAVLQEQAAEKMRRRIESALPMVVIKKQRDDEFYLEFEHAVRTSESSVNICYFAPEPPTYDPDPARKRYYRKLESEMRSRSDVTFRRIVRATEANRVWANNLAKTFSGRSNVSIALIEEDLDAEMPLALSVQTVDGVKAWLVAIEAHNRKGQYRDVYIESDAFTDAMVKYFDRLWKRSVVVLDSGRLRDGTPSSS
jgi:hypothetical protein